MFGAEDVYIDVIKTKCMPLLFNGVNCLRVDAHAMKKLSIIWNTVFRWVWLSADLNICVISLDSVLRCLSSF